MINQNGWLLLNYYGVMEMADEMDMCPLELYFEIQNNVDEPVGLLPLQLPAIWPQNHAVYTA